MDEDTLLPFDLPAVQRKKVTLGFDGGRLSSDAGVLLLREVERGLRIAERLAACIYERVYCARGQAVSVTSSAFMVVHSFQAMMYRE